MRVLLLFLVVAGVARAEQGASISLAYQNLNFTREVFSCLRSSGFDFVVINVIDPCNGSLVPSSLQTIRNARHAGLEPVEAFLNPCMPCMNGTAQAEALWRGIGKEVDFVWVGEYSGCANPSQDFDWNHEFVTSIVDALEKESAKVGVNGQIWGYIMGYWDGLAKYPLWYGGNTDLSFSDFQPFGGWKSPALKTTDSGTVCGLTVNYVYRP